MDDEEDKDEEDDETLREIFVGNLAFTVTEDMVASHFEKYGELTNIKLPMKNDRPSGIAFIAFSSSKEAAKAIAGENGK